MANAVCDALAHGLIATGVRLPAERLLAAHLGVSRGTVVSAYEVLRARGRGQTRRGSGTYTVTSVRGAMIRPAPLLSRLVEERQAPIDLAIGALQARDRLPQVAVSLADAAELLPAHGYAPLGAPALRQAIAEHLTERRGVRTRADQVVVTNGGQGALSLIAAALVRSGDRVLVEAPTYPGAIEVFSRAGARVEGVDRDHAGILPHGLERALTSRPARLLYLVPTCHNPTGGVMSEARRHEILRIAAAWRVPVIDDAVMADLLLDGPAPPDLAAIDGEGVLSVGSLSKSIWGACASDGSAPQPRPYCGWGGSGQPRISAAQLSRRPPRSRCCATSTSSSRPRASGRGSGSSCWRPSSGSRSRSGPFRFRPAAGQCG